MGKMLHLKFEEVMHGEETYIDKTFKGKHFEVLILFLRKSV